MRTKARGELTVRQLLTVTKIQKGETENKPEPEPWAGNLWNKVNRHSDKARGEAATIYCVYTPLCI